MIGRLRCLILVCLFVPFAMKAQGLNTSAIDQVLDRSGQKAGGVYRVGFPRTDSHVVVQGVSVKPGLALGSWAAFSGTDISITPLHSHLLTEQPRLFFMHFWAADNSASVAAGIKAALSHIAIK